MHGRFIPLQHDDLQTGTWKFSAKRHRQVSLWLVSIAECVEILHAHFRHTKQLLHRNRKRYELGHEIDSFYTMFNSCYDVGKPSSHNNTEVLSSFSTNNPNYSPNQTFGEQRNEKRCAEVHHY